jgi:hypothetical protein
MMKRILGRLSAARTAVERVGARERKNPNPRSKARRDMGSVEFKNDMGETPLLTFDRVKDVNKNCDGNWGAQQGERGRGNHEAGDASSEAERIKKAHPLLAGLS